MLGYSNNSQHRCGYTVVLNKLQLPLVSLVPPSASTLPSSPSWHPRPPSSPAPRLLARAVWAEDDQAGDGGQSGSWPRARAHSTSLPGRM